jgi:lactoylglutathione lyase
MRRCMKIEHVAIWTADLETLKDFYIRYFQGIAGNRYTNPNTGFQSYFLNFATEARLEIMSMPAVSGSSGNGLTQHLGLAHISFSVGTQEAVDRLTQQLAEDGYQVLDGPRWTGDGYYESQVLDPDGNRIEISI